MNDPHAPFPPQGDESPAPPGPAVPQEPGAQQTVRIKLPTIPPTVTYSLIGICIVAFIAQVATNAWLGQDWLFNLGGKVNSSIVHGELWRLFTPMFLHLSIIHIGFNMYALYVIGPQLERYYGHPRYLALFILSGFAGNVVSFIMSPEPSLGSSTAIFGLLGAQGVFFYQNRRLFGKGAQRALMNVVSIAVINLIIGLTPGIDNWGHVGDLIGGTLFAWMSGPLLKVAGVFPDLMVVDEREDSAAFQAGVTVGAIFTLLTSLTILVRKG